MIQKFFRDRVITPKAKIVDNMLNAEIALKILTNYIRGEALISRGVLISKKDIIKLTEDAKIWINNYKQNTWEDVINDTWLMSGLDSFYRSFIFPKTRQLTDSNIKQIKDFLEKIIDWLKEEFDKSKLISINPKLRIPEYLKTDIDLVIDQTMWDIKTTKYPENPPKSDINHLIICAVLAYYQNKKEKDQFPNITSIGYIFPQQLTCWKRSIANFNEQKMEETIQKIINLTNKGGK